MHNLREGAPNRHSPLGTSEAVSSRNHPLCSQRYYAFRGGGYGTMSETPDPERHMPFRGHAQMILLVIIALRFTDIDVCAPNIFWETLIITAIIPIFVPFAISWIAKHNYKKRPV